jgi:polyisoprenyl-phosphate glycosyltransferase
MNLPLQLSIVVPCFNEQDCLETTVERLISATNLIPNLNGSFEIVFVNDGSKDNTWSLIKKFCQKNPNIKGINLSRNFGHQLALTAGLQYCIGERILIIDADLQDPPELLPTMWQKMDAGFDVVYGKRQKRNEESALKIATAFYFYRIINRLSDIKIPMDTGDFRLMNRKVLQSLNKMPERDRFVRGLVAWLGYKQTDVTFERQARFSGETKYPYAKMIKLAIDAMTGFSVKPLHIAFYLSMFGVLVGVCLTVYILFQYFHTNLVPGWASLAIITVFFSTAQLFCLSIMGEYVGRTFMQAKQRPLFLIDELYSQNPTSFNFQDHS